MIQVRQAEHPTTVIRLLLGLPMTTASHAAAFELRQTVIGLQGGTTD
jgi:hypothetical protein